MTRARSLSQLANSSVFTVATNNRVGIGSEVPTAKLDVDGTLNVSGNATIGGVATYEDVTNVDSVGIVTARSGVSVPDGQKIQLGNSNDLQIYHTGSHSLIDETGTGNLTIRSSLISFEKYTNEQLARFTADGSCELFHDNSKKFETTSGGVNVTGAAFVDSPSASTGGVEISRYGVYIRSDDSYSKAFAIHNGGYTASDETILFNSNGSATFASDVEVGGGVSAADGYGTRISEGQIVFRNDNQSTTGCLRILKGGDNFSTNVVTALNNDGSATFAGRVICSGGTTTTNALQISGNNNSAKGIEVYNAGGSLNASIKLDGSAHFATHLITGSANSVVSTSEHGTYIGAGVVVNAIQPNATLAAQERAWLGKLANVTKSEIFKNGSASFAGRVNAGASNLDNRAVVGYNDSNTAGSVTANNYTSTGPVWQAYNASVNTSTPTSTIYADGSATFNGGVLSKRANGTEAAFAARTSAASDNAIELNADGSATFGQASNSTNNNGILLGANVGQLNLYTTRYSTDCFQILNTSGSGTNVAVRFDGDGTATFAGSVSATVGSFSGNVTSARTSSSHTCFNGTLNGTTTSNILANGNATFDGGITSKQEVYVLGTTTSTQRYLNFADAGTSNYRATLRRDAWYLGDPVTNIGNVTPSGAKIVLNMNGSATFEGAVAVNNLLYARQDTGTSDAFSVYSGGLAGSNKTANISGNGSATFGNRTATGDWSINPTNGIRYNSGSAEEIILDTNGSATFKGKLDVGHTYTGAEIARFGKTAQGATSYLSFHTENANYAYIGSGNQLIPTAGASDFGMRAQGNMVFSTGGQTERMRIDSSSGRVLIGKTSTQISDDGTQLLPDGQTFSSIASSSSGVNTLHVYSTTASAYRFYVGMNGTVHATNTTISAISDQRLKENIRDLDAGLAEILSLQPRRFDWRTGKGKDVQNDQGFIAQEFEQVFPEMVDEWIDPAPDGEEPYKAVRADLIPVLVKALQETHAKIETLEAEVAALKAS